MPSLKYNRWMDPKVCVKNVLLMNLTNNSCNCALQSCILIMLFSEQNNSKSINNTSKIFIHTFNSSFHRAI